MSEEKLYMVQNDKGKYWCFDYPGFWRREIIGCYATTIKEQAEKVADEQGGHVVAFVEEQKVKLPREVGEELEDYQDEDIDLLDYLHDVIDSEELCSTRAWMLGNCEQRIGILADAYRYGWEAEPEAKWYVKAPESWGLNGCYLCKHSNGQVFPDNPNPAALDSYWTQFTRAELKKYHLDSDIFTLAPVEDEK